MYIIIFNIHILNIRYFTYNHSHTYNTFKFTKLKINRSVLNDLIYIVISSSSCDNYEKNFSIEAREDTRQRNKNHLR